jgi:hypothetical protein
LTAALALKGEGKLSAHMIALASAEIARSEAAL